MNVSANPARQSGHRGRSAWPSGKSAPATSIQPIAWMEEGRAGVEPRVRFVHEERRSADDEGPGGDERPVGLESFPRTAAS